jgi:hypothetical protein
MDWSPTENTSTVPHSHAVVLPMAPAGHPTISNDIPPDEVVAIVTVHHPQAEHANRDTPYVTSPLAVGDGPGVNIFLHRINGQWCFSMGRETNNDTGTAAYRVPHDVSLPGTNVGLRQCILFPDWDRDRWRLQSLSEIVAHVNGAPVQNYTKRMKRRPSPLPKIIYLEQSVVNYIVINGLQVDVWLMKSVREAYKPGYVTLEPLEAEVQNVAHRPEQWARNRYSPAGEQVSAKSIRVIDRFTGETQTAKQFRTGEDRQQIRDREFFMFNKQDVDASIVRYLQSTEIDQIPSVITSTHEGFATYSALRDDIRKSHPGVRFAIASKLLRRLFSALAFLHFNGIIHGHVSNDSVLLRLVNEEVEHVLLVDYSTVYPFVPGVPVPVEDMISEGRSAMQLIENCCDIWAFRSGPTPNAMGEEVMQKRTMDTMHEYQTVQRVAADYFERQGNSQKSPKGQKLNRLLNKLGNAWSTAKAKQVENLADREVALLSKSKIDAKIKEWENAHRVRDPPQAFVHKQYMLLSLGHDYVDSLADQLYVKRWGITPQEVCAKIKALGGNLEEPWQTFDVHRTTSIEYKDGGYNEEAVIEWLASCYEIHPEWRSMLEMVCQAHLHQGAGFSKPADLDDLNRALQVHGQLPPPMLAMFRRFRDTETLEPQVVETYQIWFHVPSRLFNLTQLQRLGTPDRFAATVAEGEPRCDNFVEVRGDAKVQGCYASLTLLRAFADRLGLNVPDNSNLTPTIPTYDSADFSQVPQGRIVLARPGLIGYASILRSGDQCNFLFSRTEPKFITPSQFIPTHFGDMKVLPQLPPDVYSYNRPEHWSKFKTAKEFEETADSSRRDKLKAKKPKAVKPQSGDTASSTLSNARGIDDKLALGQVLRKRERVRSEARPPPKRATDAMPSKSAQSSPKRTKTGPTAVSLLKAMPDISRSFIERVESGMQGPPEANQSRSAQTQMPFMNDSFIKRNSALLTSPPLDPTNVNQSFTVADDTGGLDDDWKEVGDMLSRMPDDEADDEGLIGGIIGFRYHGDMSDESDERDEPTSAQKCQGDITDESDGPNFLQPVGKGEDKVPTSPQVRSLAKAVPQPAKGNQSSSQQKIIPFGETVISFMRQNGFEPSKSLNSPVTSKSPKEAAPSTIPVRRKPSSNPNTSSSTRFQPTQLLHPSFGGSAKKSKTPSQATVGDSSDSDMPPTRYSSPNLRVIDNQVQATAQPTQIAFGNLPTQINFPFHNTSLKWDSIQYPPTEPCSTPPPHTSFKSDSMPPTQYSSPKLRSMDIPFQDATYSSTQPTYPLDHSVIPQPDGLFDRSPTPTSPATPLQKDVDEEYLPTQYNSPNLMLLYNAPPRATMQPEPRNDEILVKDSFNGGVQSVPHNPPNEIQAMNRFNSGSIALSGVYNNPASAIAGFARELAERGDEDMADTDGESEVSSSAIVEGGVYSNAANLIAGFAKEQAQREADEDMPDTDGESELPGTDREGKGAWEM